MKAATRINELVSEISINIIFAILTIMVISPNNRVPFFFIVNPTIMKMDDNIITHRLNIIP